MWRLLYVTRFKSDSNYKRTPFVRMAFVRTDSKAYKKLQTYPRRFQLMGMVYDFCEELAGDEVVHRALLKACLQSKTAVELHHAIAQHDYFKNEPLLIHNYFVTKDAQGNEIPSCVSHSQVFLWKATEFFNTHWKDISKKSPAKDPFKGKAEF